MLYVESDQQFVLTLNTCCAERLLLSSNAGIASLLCRGVPLSAVMSGMQAAIDARKTHPKHPIDTQLILCLQRDRGELLAAKILATSLPYITSIMGLGLASTEVGYPPQDFKDVYQAAGLLGLHKVAHAGKCVAVHLDSVSALTELVACVVYTAVHNLAAQTRPVCGGKRPSYVGNPCMCPFQHVRPWVHLGERFCQTLPYTVAGTGRFSWMHALLCTNLKNYLQRAFGLKQNDSRCC